MKIMAAQKYVPVDKVCCQVTLVKPTDTNAELEEDYGLNEVVFE